MSDFIREIDQTLTVTPTLWWLGHAGFVVRFANITFYVDPCLTTPPGRTRRVPAPCAPAEVRNADMVLSTHAHAPHLDAATILPILENCRPAKLILPKSAADAANAAGIPYNRMTTTDSGLRVEYFKENLYGRVYAVPSAHPDLDWTPAGGYPYLGYLIRFGRWTIYHAGDCVLYPELATHLRPFNVNVALLPIGGKTMSVSDAAQLAGDIGAKWVAPMRYGTFDDPGNDNADESADEGKEQQFLDHMLGHRPAQQFHIFKVGEKWTVPED